MGYSKYINNKKIDLLDFKWNLTSNPLRLMNKFYEEKVDEFTSYKWDNNFDEIVKYFIKKKNL
jgi:hypothetical protein